ncbi:hypothetical protein CO731_00850 [Aminobacter sp. MSH1]|uniref:hypothetical protein n=1 Tax=Aminobacter sp. MSH1 TaxID=374606 RepID=UPI000D3E404D|nr:hypothetical protein [Aminobacter sp. MSH1]AWC21399.1 hypothetical protein CO731_00850 [Aminobacter sp. MSH1]
MARIRTIKPEFFKHEELFEAEQETGLPLRLAFAGLWTQCDREGRFVWRPRQLKVDVLPYDDIDFARVLDALCTRGFVQKYEVENRAFGIVPSWKRHQVINNRETASAIPEPVENLEQSDAIVTRRSRVGHASQGEGKGREGKGREAKASLSEPSSDARPKSKGKRTYSSEFEAFWASYPRTPNMSKLKAFEGWHKLVDEDRIACALAVEPYKAFLKAKPDRPVMHATTFINERRFEGFTEIAAASAPKPITEADWQNRLVYARDNSKWHVERWGPMPGAADCQVPETLLQPTDGQGWAVWDA